LDINTNTLAKYVCLCIHVDMYMCIYTYSEPQLQLGSTPCFSYREPHMQILDIRKLGTFWLEWWGWYPAVL